MGNNNLKEKNKSEEEILSNPGPQVDWDAYNESFSDPNLFVVLYDFHPDEDNQLTLKMGERVHVQNWEELSEWCVVTSKQKSGYVPTKYLAPWTSLDKYPWYHGPISRIAAEYLLRSEVEGTFLVRESVNLDGQFCISLKCQCITVHFKINMESGQFCINPEKRYASLPELVEALGSDDSSGLPTRLTYVVPRKQKPTIYEACPGMPDRWEMDRSDLEMLEKLGSGQYGDVYKAKLIKSKKMAAIKTLKDTVLAEEFIKESAIMKTMKHPNLIQLLGVCSKRVPFYIVMEYMSNGNLLNFLRCSGSNDLSPTVLVYMATQIAFAMAYLESKNFIHRDLAARNCLVGEDHIVKVADFGLARVVKEETYTSQSAPMLPIKWTAPEGLAFNTFSTKSDVWAFGILLFEIVTYGKTPYPSIPIADIYLFLEGGGRMECPPNCPSKVYHLMRKCWEWNPENRPTFKEIRHELDDINCNNKGNKLQATSESVNIPKCPTINQHFSSANLDVQNIVPIMNYAKKQEGPTVRPKVFSPKTEILRPGETKVTKKSSGNSSASPTTESTPNLPFKDELFQKINNSEHSNTLKQVLTSSKVEINSLKRRPNVQPPPVPSTSKPAKAVTRPQIPPPLPPTKPQKSASEMSPKGIPKGIISPPVIPLKPVLNKISHPTLPGNSNRPTLPLKPLPTQHSC